MLFFLSKLPSVGMGTLKMREDPKLLGTDKEVDLLIPDKNFYEDFARDCSAQQISVDPFLFSPHYTDVATIGKYFRLGCLKLIWCTESQQHWPVLLEDKLITILPFLPKEMEINSQLICATI
jgi:hypothetical protein